MAQWFAVRAQDGRTAVRPYPPPRIMRRLALISAVLAAVALAAGGCVPTRQGAVPEEQLTRLQRMLGRVETASAQETRDRRHDWEEQLRGARAQEKPDPITVASLQFAIAYALEREQQYREAAAAYAEAGKGPLAPFASFRKGEIEVLGLQDRKEAIKDYNKSAMAMPQAKLWERTAPASARPRVEPNLGWPSVLASAPEGRLQLTAAAQASQLRLDLLQRGDWRYRAVSRFVTLLGGNPRYSYGLALLLISIIVKLVTTPLTSSSFRSIRAMQSLQPLIKELQEKHKGDRQALAAEQMRLFKKHKISPLGGCLPMLIQMPILIGVYQGIRFYIFQLSRASFLWIRNLAQPDMPLLIMYAVSLYVSQKLTTMPTADPKQQQMQNTMTIMMPLMFTVLFASLPAAFILYWFFYNVLITAHQYYMMRQPAPVLASPKEAQEGPPGKGRPRRRRRK